MHHYTFNTGHSRVSPRSEVNDSVILQLRSMADTGSYRIPGFDYLSVQVSIDDGAGIFTVFADRITKPMPVVHGGVAWTEPGRKKLERELEKIHAAAGSRSIPDHEIAKASPPGVPWLGVILLDSVALLGEDVIAIADFERCLAWAIIEKHK